jgi:protein-S-isoprenylcysteine O-methyltransferase Ste14
VNVQIQNDHRLITHGIYSRIRHPSYLGAWVSTIGHAALLGAPLSTISVGILMLLAYRRRISVEEQAMLLSFGAEYERYASRTARLFPHVW